MRIAVFIKNTTLHNKFGGFETQNRTLCEGLAQKNHDVTVFAPKKELSEALKTENYVTYVFVPCLFRRFSSIFFASKESWEHKSYEEFKDHHAKQPFDIVISQSSWGLGVIKHKKEFNIPFIAISHGSKMGEVHTRLQSINSIKHLVRLLIDIPHILRAFFITQRQSIHGVDKIIAVSTAVKKAIIEETFVDEKKVEVIHNGIDPAKFEQAVKATQGDNSIVQVSGSTGTQASNLAPPTKSMAVDDNAKNAREVQILYVGRVLREKGLFVLVNALAQFPVKNFKLNIIGDGDDMQALSDYIEKLGLSRVVNLAGWQTQDVVISILLKSDIFVLPTLRIEGFPMTFVEAMFAGLPIVASNLGGNSDAIDNEKTGFLIPPNSTHELKQKLQLLINDVPLRQKLGQNGKIKAQNMFTLDAMLKKYEKVMQQVLQESNLKLKDLNKEHRV